MRSRRKVGVGIVLLEVFLDGSDQHRHALEHAPAYAVVGDQTKEAFDLVDPGGR